MLDCSVSLFDSELEGHIFFPPHQAQLNNHFLQATGVGGREMVSCSGYWEPGHRAATCREHYT